MEEEEVMSPLVVRRGWLEQVGSSRVENKDSERNKLVDGDVRGRDDVAEGESGESERSDGSAGSEEETWEDLPLSDRKIKACCRPWLSAA